jgi:hypothetical protein
MSRENKLLLFAEEQLAYGRYLSEIMAARDELRLTHPDSLLLQLANAKIKRLLGDGHAPPGGWHAFETLTPSCNRTAA